MNTDKTTDAAEPPVEEAEAEDTSSDEIVRPFDPNKIRVNLWTPTLDLVLKRIKEGEIDLAPDFQRKAGIWKDKAQSRLIESILIRIPLPAFYVDGISDDLMAVIDGIQRLTALKRFVLDNELRLTGLEFLTDLDGKTFKELPRGLQRRIEETMVTVNIIEKGTPIETKLNLFKRINTSGMSLAAQEIRHAINPGPVREFLRRLATSDEFMRATARSLNADRMDDRECVLRFVAFILTPPHRYPSTDLDPFLNEAMKAINQMTPERRIEFENRFKRAMTSAADILGKKAFRKIAPDGRRGPINKALFEAWSINLDGCTDQQIATLVERRDALVAAFAKQLGSDADFEKALSQGTGDKNKVRLRFRTILDLIRDIMQ